MQPTPHLHRTCARCPAMIISTTPSKGFHQHQKYATLLLSTIFATILPPHRTGFFMGCLACGYKTQKLGIEGTVQRVVLGAHKTDY